MLDKVLFERLRRRWFLLVSTWLAGIADCSVGWQSAHAALKRGSRNGECSSTLLGFAFPGQYYAKSLPRGGLGASSCVASSARGGYGVLGLCAGRGEPGLPPHGVRSVLEPAGDGRVAGRDRCEDCCPPGDCNIALPTQLTQAERVGMVDNVGLMDIQAPLLCRLPFQTSLPGRRSSTGWRRCGSTEPGFRTEPVLIGRWRFQVHGVATSCVSAGACSSASACC